MAGFGRGGRGAALLKLLEEPPRKPGSSNGEGKSGQTTTPSPTQPTSTAPTMSFGRGFAAAKAKDSGEDKPASAPKVVGFGRGLSGFSSSQPGRGTTPSAEPSRKTPSPPDGGSSGKISPEAATPGPGGDSIRSRSPQERELVEGMEKMSFQKQERGTAGQEIHASANYIPIHCKNRAVWQYAVSYDPDVDHKGMRRRLLFEHSDVIGKVRAFDGSILYLPMQLPQKVTTFVGHRQTDQMEIKVKVQLVKELEPESCTHLYNVIFKRVMKILQMQQVGRHYYQPKLSITIPQHRLEVWPGYITAIQEYSGGLMLHCDVSHKVLNYETVLETMTNIYERDKSNYMDACIKELVGCVVLTKYNNQTYRVDDIDWNLNPECKFQLRKGDATSYQDYYRKSYGLEIKDGRQPLLVNWPKKRQPDEEVRPIHLIPELCCRTGLTDKMREDFKVMKDLSQHTRVTPNQRHLSFRKFIENVAASQEATQELADWGLELDKGILQLTARQLQREKILFQNNTIMATAEADWGRELSKNSVITPVDLNSWLIIYTRRDQQRASDFMNSMKEVCPKMGIRIGQPIMCAIQDDRTQTYLAKIRDAINPGLQMVVAIFPTSRDDRYSAFKKLCCIEAPIPSQAIISRTISQKQKLRSVTQKIALQLNCKMGGELWALNIPLKGLMVVGIDVYHEKNQRSIGAFVASMNSTLTRWFSRVCFQQQQQELIDGLKVCMTASLRKYHEVNHSLPEKIVIYRDGVGDGQLAMVATYEKEQLSQCFSYFDNYNPSMAIVVVQKRINTRLFHVLNDPRSGKDNLGNPMPGMVVDHTITRRNWHDFFLVSQHVRQGTVSPTHYVVVYNSTQLKPDHHQRLAYKLTHLYYNWPGTVRVPAPCQYAHKLAYLVGQNLHKEPDHSLADRLYFL
ncbi:Piwi-like protein 2 [Holothuria leucospilota]|uniref:Piwi-like protein 2 n=1 Tax=Holothuria leucospilota TaxID=206669 RepID=A0A9Q1BDU8_HOLLE|nr:Piwi-like protein 2 [Holothuria leucospilota]